MNVTRTGSAKWMGTPDKSDLRDGTALLEITTKTGTAHYWVFVGDKLSSLKKLGSSEVYIINKGGKNCSCPDARKGNTCKHVKALAAALPRIA